MAFFFTLIGGLGEKKRVGNNKIPTAALLSFLCNEFPLMPVMPWRDLCVLSAAVECQVFDLRWKLDFEVSWMEERSRLLIRIIKRRRPVCNTSGFPQENADVDVGKPPTWTSWCLNLSRRTMNSIIVCPLRHSIHADDTEWNEKMIGFIVCD